jgi:hypothetical protein
MKKLLIACLLSLVCGPVVARAEETKKDPPKKEEAKKTEVKWP